MNERTLFLEALEIADPERRAAFLQVACGQNADLRRGVEELLQADASAGSFMDAPAATIDAASADTVPENPLSLDFLAKSDRPSALGRLGNYEIMRVIGTGGMGIVLEGCDARLDRVVAVKVLAPQLAATAAARQRFLREAKAAAAVRDEHVVTIYAVEEAAGFPYLVMELIAGQSLQEKIDREGHLRLIEILRIGQQVAAGLAAAHAHGLMHRDVKPANILLENGVERVRITDFGLARAVDDVGVTKTGEIAGTPQYMSPEQAQGLPMDARSDLFSLGCVLYAMCTGRSPFRAETVVATARRVCEDTPRPIREVNPEIPERLVEIIDRLLAKRPDERFQTAADVAELLGQDLAQLQHPAVVEKASRQSVGLAAGWKPAPYHRPWVVIVAAVVLLLLGISLSEATGVTNLAPTLLRIVTGEGTLVVEVNDPAVKVTVEGDGGLVIAGAGLHEVHLKPGTYQLRADKDGKRVPLNQELVTITRANKEVVRVRRESSAPAMPVDPLFNPTYYELGIALYAQKRTDEAARALRLGLEHDNELKELLAQGSKLAPTAQTRRTMAYNAPRLLLVGDTDNYHRLCTRAITVFGDTDDPDSAYHVARVCALGPDSPSDSNRLVQLAERAVRAGPFPHYLHTLGLACYRAGRFDEAIQHLHTSIAGQWSANAANWLVLAMAHQRLGHADEARKWYDKAVAWIDNPGADGLNSLHRIDFMACLVLRREAETLLGPPLGPREKKEPAEEK